MEVVERLGDEQRVDMLEINVSCPNVKAGAIAFGQNKDALYDILIFELYSIDFSWVIPLDSDRGYDGLVLREGFHSSNGIENSLKNKPCSVLEVLISLAERFDFLVDDEDRGDRTRIWFWEMVENLGLLKYSNAYFDEPYGRRMDKINDIHRICERWLDRKFSYTGQGSPFPLDHPNEDQRKADMVSQLNQYVLEKHMYEDELL